MQILEAGGLQASGHTIDGAAELITHMMRESDIVDLVSMYTCHLASEPARMC